MRRISRFWFATAETSNHSKILWHNLDKVIFFLCHSEGGDAWIARARMNRTWGRETENKPKGGWGFLARGEVTDSFIPFTVNSLPGNRPHSDFYTLLRIALNHRILRSQTRYFRITVYNSSVGKVLNYQLDQLRFKSRKYALLFLAFRECSLILLDHTQITTYTQWEPPVNASCTYGGFGTGRIVRGKQKVLVRNDMAQERCRMRTRGKSASQQQFPPKVS